MSLAKLNTLAKIRFLLFNWIQVPGYFILILSVCTLISEIRKGFSFSLALNKFAGSEQLDIMVFIMIIIFIGLLLVLFQIFKRLKILRLLKVESSTIKSTLVHKWYLLPSFIVNMIKKLTFGLFPIFCSFEFEYSIKNKKYKIFKIANDNGLLVENEIYDIIVNSNKLAEAYVIELLPMTIRYYLNK
jgi:hypothetical protein